MVEKYSDDDFEALLSKYDYKFKRGDIVKGVVCAFESDGAIVDIGSKSTAFVPSYEVSSDRKAKAESVLEKNTEYEFLITQDADENGKFTLSYKKVAAAHTWTELEKVKEALSGESPNLSETSIKSSQSITFTIGEGDSE